MRAVRMHAHGGPEVLRVDEVSAPRPPRREELLVAVTASSVNGTDLGLRRGGMRLATAGRLPARLGFDLVGEVVDRGPQVSAFDRGDRVAALLGHGGGGQADLVLVAQHRAARVPATVSDLDAASIPLAGLTALQALFTGAGLAGRPRARVLVLGAAGGIGAFAVQLAALAGAHVTGLSAAARLGQVRSWGATEVLDRHSTDPTNPTHLDRLVDSGERWDVVLDAHGGASYSGLRRLLRPHGVVVSTRPVSPDTWRTAPQVIRRRVHRRDLQRPPTGYRFVATRASSPDLAHLLHLLDRAALVAPTDTVFDLSAISDAHRRAETGAAGKVVLRL